MKLKFQKIPLSVPWGASLTCLVKLRKKNLDLLMELNTIDNFTANVSETSWNVVVQYKKQT